jgi:hypothetical protein
MFQVRHRFSPGRAVHGGSDDRYARGSPSLSSVRSHIAGSISGKISIMRCVALAGRTARSAVGSLRHQNSGSPVESTDCAINGTCRWLTLAKSPLRRLDAKRFEDCRRATGSPRESDSQRHTISVFLPDHLESQSVEARKAPRNLQRTATAASLPLIRSTRASLSTPKGEIPPRALWT